MVETLQPGSDLPQAVEALAALTRVNGPAQFQGLQKIHVLDAIRAPQLGSLALPLGMGADAANLLGQAHLSHMAGLAPFHQTQSALRRQSPNGLARGAYGELDVARQPWNREPQQPLAFQPAVAQEMGIDHVIDDREA